MLPPLSLLLLLGEFRNNNYDDNEDDENNHSHYDANHTDQLARTLLQTDIAIINLT